MKADDYWKLFMETGAPECYLMFRSECRREQQDVFEDTGLGTPANGVQ